MVDPIQEDLRKVMNELGKVLADGLKPYGFALLVFPFGHGEQHRMNYISNASREGMIAALKELLANFEGRHVSHGTKQ